MSIRPPMRADHAPVNRVAREQRIETSLQRARREEQQKERRELLVIIAAAAVILGLLIFGLFGLFVRH